MLVGPTLGPTNRVPNTKWCENLDLIKCDVMDQK